MLCKYKFPLEKLMGKLTQAVVANPNAVDHRLSYYKQDICNFLFSRKTSRWPPKIVKKKNFFLYNSIPLLPCGSKICSKSLYLLPFPRYLQFFILRKNPRWPPKFVKIEIFLSFIVAFLYYPGG